MDFFPKGKRSFHHRHRFYHRKESFRGLQKPNQWRWDRPHSAEYYHNATKPDTPDETSSEEVRMKYAEWEARHLELVNKATLIVAKQRHGSTGNVPLLFHSEYTKFSSPDVRNYEDYD